MRKITTILLFIFCINLFSQDIQNMNKKELRIAFEELKQNKNKTNDSLKSKLEESILWGKKKKNEIDSLSNIVLELKESLNEIEKRNRSFESKIFALQKTIQLKEAEIKKLSIKPLKLDIFSKIPKEFFDIGVTYSENKGQFKEQKYILRRSGEQCMIYIDNKLVVLNELKDEVQVNDNYNIMFFKNDNFNIQIIEKYIDNETGIEDDLRFKATVTIKDQNGQELILHLNYGVGE